MQTNEGGSYEIRLKGHLAPRWADWFDGLTLTQESDGTTLVSSPNLIGFRTGARPRGDRLRGHPANPSADVVMRCTSAWAVITSLKFAMCLLFVVGITGLFAEAFIRPPLAAMAPEFVDALLRISYGHTGAVNLGALPTIYSVGVGVTYMLGGLLVGIATLRPGDSCRASRPGCWLSPPR